MWALDQPCAPRAGRLFADTPLALLAVLALGAATTWALVELGVLPPHAMHIAGVTAGHGVALALGDSGMGVRVGRGGGASWRRGEHAARGGVLTAGAVMRARLAVMLAPGEGETGQYRAQLGVPVKQGAAEEHGDGRNL